MVPVRKQPGLKAGAFSRALLVPVAETRINGLYKPGLKAFFLPVKPQTESTNSSIDNLQDGKVFIVNSLLFLHSQSDQIKICQTVGRNVERNWVHEWACILCVKLAVHAPPNRNKER
jgi:hypothetical protein